MNCPHCTVDYAQVQYLRNPLILSARNCIIIHASLVNGKSVQHVNSKGRLGVIEEYIRPASVETSGCDGITLTQADLDRGLIREQIDWLCFRLNIIPLVRTFHEIERHIAQEGQPDDH